MKKLITILGIMICAIVLFASCGSGNNDKSKESSESLLNEEAINNQKEINDSEYSYISASFEFEKIEEDYPKTTIYAVINDEKTEIAKIAGHANTIDKSEYSTYSIPKDAIDACSSWWAGAGDYFYMALTEKGVDVYAGWQDEQQEDEGCHWEKRNHFNQKLILTS